MGGRIKDISGQRFGRVTAIKYVRQTEKHYAVWLCKCDCGNFFETKSTDLIQGHTMSCGCYRKEVASKRLKEKMTKHNMGNTRLYGIWQDMKQRCFNKTCKAYLYYGGRGITVCDEWKSDFQTFYDWAMSNGYEEHLTIDRIDNNKNYEPNNCRWATRKEQAQNRNCCMLTYNGETHTLAEWSEIIGIKKRTIEKRKNKFKLPIELILFTSDLRFKKNKGE